MLTLHTVGLGRILVERRDSTLPFAGAGSWWFWVR
jgi:hypothetical protein